MKILVVNAGSSSLKYQLIDMENESVILKGLCERITFSGSVLTQKTFDGRQTVIEQDMPTHKEAMELVLKAMLDKERARLRAWTKSARWGIEFFTRAKISSTLS